MLALNLAEMIREATVAKEPGHRGEREVSRKPLRRESRRDPVEPVVLPPCFLLHGTHGCDRHPAFPAPSVFQEGSRSRKTQAFYAVRCGPMPPCCLSDTGRDRRGLSLGKNLTWREHPMSILAHPVRLEASESCNGDQQ
jgi:hypothetical protein